MLHDAPLISTIVAGFVLAFIFGTLANRLKLPPLVGYLFAGILVGPNTPGWVADQNLAPQLAELGVILLMFGVGLHFTLKDLLSVRFIAVPGAIVQIAIATALGWSLGAAMGWSFGGSLLFGIALSVASTVVLLSALQERRLLESERGRIAVGWLIVEDLAMVLVLVLAPAIASIAGGDSAGAVSDPLAGRIGRFIGIDLGVGGIIAVTFFKVALFVALMLVVGRRVIPWLLHRIAHTGSRELFRLAVLAIALGVAFIASELFGASLALGAFFAGMVLSESELSHRAAQESLPLRDAFSVLFFVSVGMLFEPRILIEQPLPLIGAVAIILVGKTVAALLIVLAFRLPLGTALTISASLAQIGEFSFILADLGVRLGVLPGEGRNLILSGALISIILNPLVFSFSEWLRARSEDAPSRRDRAAETRSGQTEAAPSAGIATAEEQLEDALSQTVSQHVVIAGHGRVGSIVVERLAERGVPFVVIEDEVERVQNLRERHIQIVVGNAASGEVLARAGVERARLMMVAIPNAFEAGQAVQQARQANPGLSIVARAHSDEEVEHLTRLGADAVIMGEREIALGMLEWLDRPKTSDRSASAALPDGVGADPQG